MLTFSLVLFPAAFFALCLNKKQNLLVALFSVLCAGIVAFLRGFFVFPESFAPLNFFQIILRFFFPMCFIPAFFYTFFFFFSRDDSESKKDSMLCFLLPFFAVTLPFETIRNFPVHNFYVCFLRPVVYLSFVFAATATLKKTFKTFQEENKPRGALKIFAVLAECLAVSYCDATYFLGVTPIFAVTIVVALAVFFSILASKLSK